MKISRRKKSNDLNKKKDDLTSPPKDKIKFNLSYDNLKCFINDKYPKTDRKRIANRYNFNLNGNKKFEEDSIENQSVQVHHKIIRQSSPDPSLQASNSIIEQIQKKGLQCVWNEVEQTKSQCSNQEEWHQKQRLHQTFSQCSSSLGKNHSHASTIEDKFSGYYSIQMNNSLNHHYLMQSSEFIVQTNLATSNYILAQKPRFNTLEVNFKIDGSNIEKDPRTTLMIKNIPNKYTIQDLSTEIDMNFTDTYDFLYLPCDIKNNCNVGYGFINFVDTNVLAEFYHSFHNNKWLKFRSEKICVLTYARLQGLDDLINHFQNSKVLNHKDKRYQPIIKRGIKKYANIEILINKQKQDQSNNFNS